MSWSLSLSMVEARLPPGFRFHPRDDELVVDYLSNKLRAGDGGAASGGGGGCPTLVDVDLNKCEPWDLPEIACIGGKEWYFYNLKDRKYARGKRTNRATESGYWKATGKDREITRKGSLVGMRKTLVFYRGRAPKGERTDWVMHEFRQELDHANHHHLKEDWVLCRVFYKSRTEAIAAPTTESTTTCYINGDSSTPPLPPLVDNSISSFDHGGYYEEVACFSSSHHQPSLPSMNASAAAEQDYHHLSEGQRHYSDKAMMRDLQNDQVITRFDGLAVKREMSLKKGLAGDEQVEDYYCLTDSESSETWNLFQQ